MMKYMYMVQPRLVIEMHLVANTSSLVVCRLLRLQ